MAYPTSFVLSDEQHERLQALRRRRGAVTKTDILREAVDIGLNIMTQTQDDIERLRAVHIDAARRALAGI